MSTPPVGLDPATAQPPERFAEVVLRTIVRDTHSYRPGARFRAPASGRLALAGDRCRDAVERVAARAGFSRRHFDARVAAAEIARVLDMGERLDDTYGRLADDHSRRLLIELFAHKALGPHHAQLRISPEEYRAKQTYADERLRAQADTFSTSDPFFPSLSLYEVPLPDGETLRLHSHSVDIVSVYLLGQYSYRHGHEVTVREGDVVFDVGACFGDTALLFASRVGASGKVYAFEFDPVNLEVLRANLALNPQLAERIEVVQTALWDSSGETIAFDPAGRCTSLVDSAAGSAGAVTTTTLDDFVAGSGLERLDFIKMDVEGAEPRVLRGAVQAASRLRPTLAVAAYHRDDDLVVLPQLVDAFGPGYRLFLDSFSPVVEETVLFAASESSST